MDSWPIRHIVAQIESGQVRIPAFQRGFVWEPERVAHFIDSLYKGYPFGALLFWRTNERLKSERELGGFNLPDPVEDYPIDYVLDGQQRVTSIFATFQTNIDRNEDQFWKPIYFDHTIDDDAQEPQFFALSDDEVDPAKHFPLSTLFDTQGYRRATREFNDSLAERIDNMMQKFREASLPVQLFRTEDKSTVAVIFERINRQGVPLDTIQLLSAWTWSEDFELQGEFADLVEELESKGFDLTSFDENLLLRCASAVLVSSPRPETIVTIPGERVRNNFDEVINGVLGALDFLEMNLGIRRIENLPFQTLMVPLAVFFAVSGERQIVVEEEQRQKILRWFWRASFSRRYSSGVIRYLEEDIRLMLQLKGGQKSALGSFGVEIDASFFLRNSFGVRNVNTKTFVLLLAQKKPLSFISGAPIDLNEKLKEYNKTEFHHLMPKAYFRELDETEFSVNCLANYCFLSRSENKRLGGVRPSQYRMRMPANSDSIIERALCPASLFADEFNIFVKERAELLAVEARTVCEVT